MKPIVTICIATYDRSELLRKIVEDIISSGIKTKYEILICNDSFFEDHIEVCKELSKKYDRVRYVQNDKNYGFFGNLEYNFRKIKGRYVIFPGDDDTLYPDLIDKQVGLLDKYKNVSIVAPLFRIIYKDSGLVINTEVSWKGDHKVFSGLEVVNSYVGENFGIGTKYRFVWPSLMFRMSVLEKVGSFKDCTPVAGDTLVISKTLLLGDFCQINEVLFEFVSYGDSLRSLSSKNGKAFDERLHVLELFTEFARDNSNLNDQDFASYRRKLASSALSLNGPVVWIATHFEGSYPERIRLITSIIVRSVCMNPGLLIKPLSYVVIMSGLFLPKGLFIYFAKMYAKLIAK